MTPKAEAGRRRCATSSSRPARPGAQRGDCAPSIVYFDLVLVHGDPQLARLGDSFPGRPRIRPPVGYTGLVPAGRPLPRRSSYDVMVSAGGGAAQGRLPAIAVAARAQSPLAAARWLFVTGPNAPDGLIEQLRSALRPGDLAVPFRSDFPSLLAGRAPVGLAGGLQYLRRSSAGGLPIGARALCRRRRDVSRRCAPAAGRTGACGRARRGQPRTGSAGERQWRGRSPPAVAATGRASISAGPTTRQRCVELDDQAPADQHEAGVVLELGARRNRRRCDSAAVSAKCLQRALAVDMAGLAEIVVRLQQHRHARRQQVEPAPQIGDVLAAGVDDEIGAPLAAR